MRKTKLEGLITMNVRAIFDKVKKELKGTWDARVTLPDYLPEGLSGKVIPKNQISIFVFIILTLILAGVFVNAAANTATVHLPSSGGGANVEIQSGGLEPIKGHSKENTEQHVNVSVEKKTVAEITFTLTWKDEPDQTPLVNQPDEFAINVTTPWGESNETPMTQNQHGKEGKVSLKFKAPGDYPDTGGGGYYDVIVKMGNAGDQLSPTPGVQVGERDDGNDWTLTVTYTYWEKASSASQ